MKENFNNPKEQPYNSELIEDQEVNLKELLFISDIEHFNLKISKILFKRIKKENFRAIIFIGDVLSGFSTENPYYKVFKQSPSVFEMYYDVKKIIKKHKKKSNKMEIAKYYVGFEVSKQLTNEFFKELKAFKMFVKRCNELKIPIILYSGNHDSLFSWKNCWDEKYLPVIREINSLEGLKIPFDFEIIKINKELYLTGIHTDSEEIEKSYNFPAITEILKSLSNPIKNPQNFIFVSHIPGIKKYTNLGSQDITNLKKKFKFRYHYHGHCKNYYEEYDEEGVPTKSIHFEDRNYLEAETKKGEIKLRRK